MTNTIVPAAREALLKAAMKAAATSQNDDITSLYDIMEAWADRRIDSATAIRKGGFAGFGELLKTTLEHDIKLSGKILPEEQVQADNLVTILLANGFEPRQNKAVIS